MSKGVKIALVVVIVIIVLVILGYVMAKYTTVGVSSRINRLHDQIETRYVELNEIYEGDEAKAMLETELNDNRLVESAEFDEDLLVICYVNGECEDYYVGVED
ncbi:hypothetical protein ACFL0Z_00565 [Patescibacteria group bacterium]